MKTTPILLFLEKKYLKRQDIVGAFRLIFGRLNCDIQLTSTRDNATLVYGPEISGNHSSLVIVPDPKLISQVALS
jgi:hypothetical protein